MLPADLRPELRWLAGGFLLTLSSGFGQTYFIALFAGELKAALEITDGEFGALYTLATLSSAAALTWAGKLADRLSARALGVGVLAALALTSLGMANVASAWVLGLVLFGLRFFGQGMLTHVAMTAMGRWFHRKRGRAVAIAALGLPAAEAVLPLLAVALIALVGWRGAWAAAAGALVLVSIPTLSALLAKERVPATDAAAPASGSSAAAHSRSRRRDWTRKEVLRSPVFYALLPGVLATPLVVTGLFFNQVTIGESKGWPLSWFAASFPVLAAMHVLSALAAGWLIDRFGARRLLPWIVLPLGIATVVVTYAESPVMLVIFMALIGVTQGGSSTTQGALWPELFGTAHLGAVRSIVLAGVVFASALAPGGIGILLDAGVAIETQFLVMGVFSFAVAAWMAALLPALHRLARGEGRPSA